MENWHIVVIVFGSSATIMFILIVMFKWMSIKFFGICCRGRKKTYKVDGIIASEPDIDRKVSSDPPFIIDKSGFSPCMTRSNRVSVDTHETCDDDFPFNFNNDPLVVHVKPVLKPTNRCSLDLSGQTSIDNELNVGELHAEAQVEVNFSPLQEMLELKVISLNNLNLEKMFLNCDEIDPNRIREFDIISATELFQAYCVTWLDESLIEKKMSKVRAFSTRLEINEDFKWFVDEASLMRTQVNLAVYAINNTNGFQLAIAQTSFKVQDIYAHKLTRIWLPLNEIKEPAYQGDILISLSYLPTAERLTVVVIEAKNLKFDSNAIFGSSFAKVSLLNEKGRMLESFMTSVRVNDPNPQFNEVTVFNVKSIDFNRIYLKVSLFEVKNSQRIRLGQVYIGPSSTNGHWPSVLRQVRRQIAMWHRLTQ